jgi:hypothetical protein
MCRFNDGKASLQTKEKERMMKIQFIFRGGDYDDVELWLNCFERTHHAASFSYDGVGFRPIQGQRISVRGSSCYDYFRQLVHCATRNYFTPAYCNFNLGFRPIYRVIK